MKKVQFVISLIILITLLAIQHASPATAAAPSIKFTYVPPYGIPKEPPINPPLLDSAKGKVLNVNPANYPDYYIVCYIYVNVLGTQWWIKPSFAKWKTIIKTNGSWACDVGTGGSDEKATIIEAYLIRVTPNDPTTAPSRDWLQGNASAKIAARRVPSQAAADGWVLECNETSNTGCAKKPAGLLNVGDNAANKQYRSILSFSMASKVDHPSMPTGATIARVSIRISRASVTGIDPFTMLGNLLADIRQECFGASCALEIGDFQATASGSNIGSFKPISGLPGWYQVVVGSTNYQYFDPTINTTKVTQFRMRFSLDDNNNTSADNVSFYAGDIVNTLPMTYPSLPPVLIIEYKIP